MAVVGPLAHGDTGGDLPAVVLVHGMTFSKATWDPIVDRLRDRFRCLSVDLPGHGESAGSGADPHVVVERIHATVVENGVVTPVLVGHSAGALHATGYGSAHDSAGVVNVDQPLRVGPFAGFVQALAPALHGPDFGAAFEPFGNGDDQLGGVIDPGFSQNARIGGVADYRLAAECGRFPGLVGAQPRGREWRARFHVRPSPRDRRRGARDGRLPRPNAHGRRSRSRD